MQPYRRVGKLALSISDNARLEMDALYCEFLEATILEHAEMVQAARCTNLGKMLQPRNWSSISDWKAVKETLTLLGFEPEATDAWRLLSIPRDDGPMPSIEMIERRAKVARLFASSKQTATWIDSDRAAAATFENKLEKAEQTCMKDLPRVIREKRKLRNKLVPWWLEPSPELLTFYHDMAQRAGPDHKVALNLPNVQGISLDQYGQMLSTETARELYESLHKNKMSRESVFRGLGHGSITVWAPTDKATLSQLLIDFQKFALTPNACGSIHLIVPHNNFPGARHQLKYWTYGVMNWPKRSGK